MLSCSADLRNADVDSSVSLIVHVPIPMLLVVISTEVTAAAESISGVVGSSMSSQEDSVERLFQKDSIIKRFQILAVYTNVCGGE